MSLANTIVLFQKNAFLICILYLPKLKAIPLKRNSFHFIAVYRLYMDPFAASSPQEVIERVSEKLGCSTTSRDVAEYFDQHDKLRDLRQEFLVPKVADLPQCNLVYFSLNNIQTIPLPKNSSMIQYIMVD